MAPRTLPLPRKRFLLQTLPGLANLLTLPSHPALQKEQMKGEVSSLPQ